MWGVFYLWLSKASANKRRRYIRNVFSHWLTPISATDNNAPGTGSVLTWAGSTSIARPLPGEVLAEGLSTAGAWGDDVTFDVTAPAVGPWLAISREVVRVLEACGRSDAMPGKNGRVVKWIVLNSWLCFSQFRGFYGQYGMLPSMHFCDYQHPGALPSQRAHDAKITSLWRQNDVATSFWRHNDVIIASCAG